MNKNKQSSTAAIKAAVIACRPPKASKRGAHVKKLCDTLLISQLLIVPCKQTIPPPLQKKKCIEEWVSFDLCEAALQCRHDGLSIATHERHRRLQGSSAVGLAALAEPLIPVAHEDRCHTSTIQQRSQEAHQSLCKNKTHRHRHRHRHVQAQKHRHTHMCTEKPLRQELRPTFLGRCTWCSNTTW